MNKLVILFYNTNWGTPLQFKENEWPEDCMVTTDRNLMAQADAVVFHLPNMRRFSNGNLQKKVGQIWIVWNLECETNYSWIMDEKSRSCFDLWMGYKQTEYIPYAYYSLINLDNLRLSGLSVGERLNKTCMFGAV